jgi:hypothetical protein
LLALRRILHELFTWPRVKRALVLALGLLAIGYWQHGFLDDDTIVPATNVVTASTGINRDRDFFYYLYYLNLYPLAPTPMPHVDSHDEAERVLRASPKTFVQDIGSTFRSGDRYRTYLYFVDAWRHHNALTPSLKPTHALAFTIALAVLYTAFWTMRRTGAGALLVVLFGSNPFQLHTIYREENVFSWAGTLLVLALALHLPLIVEKPTRVQRYKWICALLTGALFAAARNVRGEATVLLLAPVAVYLTVSAMKWHLRLGLVFALAVSFQSVTTLSNRYMDYKVNESATTLGRFGGTPFEGPIAHFHEFWHVIFCGLGDFDKTHGYEWNDAQAYRFAAPELSKRNGGIEVQINNAQKRSYDGGGRYPIYIFEIPHYDEIIREKVIGDIKSEPGWFVHILRLRFTRTMASPVPVGITLWNHSFYLSGGLLTWGCVPLAIWLAVKKRWPYLKMLLFAVPLTFAPVMIYSGGGMTNYSSFHIVGVWIFAQLLLEGFRSAKKRRSTLRLSREI